MADKEPSRWRQLPKLSFSSKDLSRRMRKVEGATVKHARRFVFRRWDNFKEVRRHIALWALAVGIIIGATGLQLMWYQQTYRTAAHANDGTYAEAVLGPVQTLNPIFASTSAETSISQLLFSRLLAYDATGHLNFDAASNMKISKDERTYTFEIRADARWNDGIYVRAKDVVFTVNLLKDPTTRSTITGWEDVQVKEVDDRTVSFTLPAVYAAFPHALTFLPILPEHVLRDVDPSAIRENEFSRNPMTSGPFSVRFTQDIDRVSERKIIHLARNDEYYRGTPKLDRFQIHVYNSREAIARALNTSEVNAATDLTVIDTQQLNKERYTVERKSIYGGVYALFNTTGPILDNKDIRKALQVGTDTSKVREALGEGTPALTLPFIADQISKKAPNPPAYNQASAERLLTKAGWKRDGDVRKKGKEVLRLSIVTVKNNDFEKALDVLVEQWRTLGITVTTNIVDPSDPSQNIIQDVLQPRNYDVLIYPLSIGGDPDVYAYWHSSQASDGFNFSNYDNAISDDSLASARVTVNPELRSAKYVTFARQWIADAPAIGLYQQTIQYAYSKSVHSIQDSDVLISATDRYTNVLYWSVGSRLVHQTP